MLFHSIYIFNVFHCCLVHLLEPFNVNVSFLPLIKWQIRRERQRSPSLPFMYQADGKFFFQTQRNYVALFATFSKAKTVRRH